MSPSVKNAKTGTSALVMSSPQSRMATFGALGTGPLISLSVIVAVSPLVGFRQICIKFCGPAFSTEAYRNVCSVFCNA